MACPKKKTSHQKQHSRRSNWKAKVVTLTKCANCGATKRPHTMCHVCGYYRGRPALKAEQVI